MWCWAMEVLIKLSFVGETRPVAFKNSWNWILQTFSWWLCGMITDLFTAPEVRLGLVLSCAFTLSWESHFVSRLPEETIQVRVLEKNVGTECEICWKVLLIKSVAITPNHNHVWCRAQCAWHGLHGQIRDLTFYWLVELLHMAEYGTDLV